MKRLIPSTTTPPARRGCTAVSVICCTVSHSRRDQPSSTGASAPATPRRWLGSRAPVPLGLSSSGHSSFDSLDWSGCRHRQAQRPARAVAIPGLQHLVGHHLEKQGIVVHRGRPRHRQTDIAAYLSGFDVQVVQHLHVIANEPDRTDHRSREAAGSLGPQVLADVRFEPRVLRPAAAALEYQRPVGHAKVLSHQPRRLQKLRAKRWSLG